MSISPEKTLPGTTFSLQELSSKSQAHTVSSGDLALLTLTSLFFVGFAWREEQCSLIFLFRAYFILSSLEKNSAKVIRFLCTRYF